MKLVIMRGLPGAGKSTYVSGLPDAVTCSADKYVDYSKFSPGMIPVAHNKCFLDCEKILNCGAPLVIVDNTNLENWQIAPYMLMGTALGYSVEIVNIECAPETAWKRQVHNVPFKTFCFMVASFYNEKLMPWWTVRHLGYGSSGKLVSL